MNSNPVSSQSLSSLDRPLKVNYSDPLALSVNPGLSNPFTSQLQTTSASFVPREVVFIDTGISDYQTLAAGVDPADAIVLLNSNQDGIAQISAYLAEHQGISAVHIVSHGSTGSLQLGSGQLNLETLGDDAAALQGWAQALTEDADIVLYGCGVAAGESGRSFVQWLSQLTGADVAASNDLTGSAALGGDWDLEVDTGEIATSLAFSASTLQSYSTTLAAIAPEQAAVIKTGLQGLVAWANTLESFGALAQALPLTDSTTGTVKQAIGEILDLSDLLQTQLVTPAINFLDAGGPTTEGLLALLDGLSGTTGPVTATVNGDKIQFDLVFDATRTTNVKLAPGSDAAAKGLFLKDATVGLNTQLHFDFSFGVDLTPGLAQAEAFFVEVDQLLASATINAPGQTLNANVGSLEIQLQNTNLNLNAGVNVGLNDPNSDGKITLTELQGTTLGSLVSLTPTGTFNAAGTVAVNGNLFVPASTAIALSDTNVFDAIAPTFTADQDLLNFNTLSPTGLVNLLKQLGAGLQSISTKLDVPGKLPFISQKISDFAKLSEAIADITNKLVDSNGNPTFTSIQTFVNKLDILLPELDQAGINLQYNPASNQLSFRLKYTKDFDDKTVNLNFSNDLTLLSITGLANGTFDAKAGVDLIVGVDISPLAPDTTPADPTDNDTLEKRLFLQEGSKLFADATISANGINLSGKLGLLEAGIQNGTTSITAKTDVTLTDPVADRIKLVDLLSSPTTFLPASPNIIANLTGNLPISVAGINLGVDPANPPAIALSLATPNNLGSLQFTPNASFTQLVDQFKNFSIADVTGAITQLINVLKSPSFGALNIKIPLINKSLNDLLGITTELTQAVTSLTAASDVTLQNLAGKLSTALGLSSPSSVSLEFVDGNADPGIYEQTLLVKLHLAENFSQDVSLDFSLPDVGPITVDSSGKLPVSASGILDLNFGVNLATKNSFLLDSSAVNLTTGITKGDFKASAGFGAISVGLGSDAAPGTISLKNAANTADASVVIDITDTPAAGDIGAIAFSNVLSNLSATADGKLDATIPIFVAGVNIGNLLASLNLATGAGSVTPPADLISKLTAADLNLETLTAGIDIFISTLESALKSKILGALPIVGDDINLAGSFITKLRTQFLDPLKTVITGGNVAQIQQTIFNGIGSLLVFDHDSNPATPAIKITDPTQIPVIFTPGKVEIQLHLSDRDDLADLPLAKFDLGLGGLDFKVLSGTGGIKVGYDYDLQLGFGITKTQGFYLDLNDDATDSELEFDLDVGLTPGSNLETQLFLLKLRAIDNGTGINGKLNVNLKDPDLTGDEQLSVTELGADFISWADASLKTPAKINLKLDASVIPQMPSLSANLVVDWTDPFLGSSVPVVQIADVTLNLGQFLSTTLGPILETITKYIAPLKPVLDILDTEIPVISDLTKLVGLGPTTFLDAIGSPFFGGSGNVGEVRKVLRILKGVSDLASQISALGSGVAIDFGDFDFSQGAGIDLRNPFTFTDNLFQPGSPFLVGGFGDFNGFLNQTGNAKDKLSEMKKPPSETEGFGIQFPLFESPGTIFKLLFGQKDIDLITWDIPRFDASFAFTKTFPTPLVPPFPIFPTIGGSLSVFADLDIGFDTRGLLDTGKFLDGFYFDNRKDSAELGLTAELTAGGELNLALISGGVEGGIRSDITANWNDNDKNGKVYLDELEANFARSAKCVFDMKGEFTAFLRAYIEFFYFFGSHREDFPIVSITLFDFNTSCPPVKPVLAHTEADGRLVLHVGPNADLRLPGAGPDDGDETIKVRQLSNGVMEVSGFGETQVYGDGNEYPWVKSADNKTITSIFANGGIGNDTILIDNEGDDRVTVTTQLLGGDGDDQLVGGAVADTIEGGKGNDQISGGAGNDSLDGQEDNDQIFGNAGADTIKGGSGNDQLRGGNGLGNQDGDEADTIFGGDGNDSISGDLGNDTLFGDNATDTPQAGVAYNDSIRGGAGNDSIFAGLGDDIAYGDAGSDTIRGGEGKDFLIGEGAEVQAGQGGNDIIFGDGGDDTIQDNDPTVGGVEFGDDEFHGGADNDTITSGIGKDKVFGDGDSDIINSGDGDDYVEGGAGNDRIQSGKANDRVIGGASTVVGVDGRDIIEAGEGDDIVLGDDGQIALNGTVVLLGGAGNDDIFGGSGRDRLFGQGGNDLIEGGLDEDEIFGGGGNDTLLGQEANDLIEGGADDDQITGGLGNDRIIGGVSNLADLFGGLDGSDSIIGDGGNDVILGDNGTIGVVAGQVVSVITNPNGGSGNDTVFGGDGNDIIFGGGNAATGIGDQLIGDSATGTGVDIIVGDQGTLSPTEIIALTSPVVNSGGRDLIRGSGGNDILLGGDGNDDIFADAGLDVAIGDNGKVTRSGSVITRIETRDPASGGNDIITGGTEADIVLGGTGNDSIDGGSDNAADILLGDNGVVVRADGSAEANDIFSTDPDNGGKDIISGGGGNDIILGGSGNADATGVGGDNLSGGTGNDVVVGDNAYITRNSDDAIQKIETRFPNKGGDDAIAGNDGDDVLLGGFGNDNIQGNQGNDIALGDNGLLDYTLDGNLSTLDLIITTDPTLGGTDAIAGNDGNDIALGGAAGDNITGNAGKDVLLGDNGRITLTGGEIELIETTDPGLGGADDISGNEDNDLIAGGFAGDTLSGNDGDDIILGDNGKFDYAYAGDNIVASDSNLATLDFFTTTDPTLGGNDLILGGLGNDTAMGGTGSDRIYGDEGVDALDANWFIAGVADLTGDGQSDILWRNRETGNNLLWQMQGNRAIAATPLPAFDVNVDLIGTADFDQDGQVDLLLRNRLTGQNLLWLMNGTGLKQDKILPIAVPGWDLGSIADFNKDGFSDILWRNRFTGENVIWKLNGSGFSGFANLLTADPNWCIGGIADFNKDGFIDILWQNQATWKTSIWNLNGTSFGSAVDLPLLNPNWEFKAVADFNKDTFADILLRNRVTGENLIWKLNGTSFGGTTPLPIADLNWNFSNITDFDGDGFVDVLWRNQTTLQSVIWKLNGTGFNQPVFLAESSHTAPIVSGAAWEVVQKADFNKDGQEDLLWRNRLTGQNAIWTMNGTNLKQEFLLAIADLNWSVAGTADFNKDGFTDILWRNQVTGENVVWKLNGTSVNGVSFLPIADSRWGISSLTDFDKDGFTDVLLRNRITGENVIWKLNSTGFNNAINLLSADPNWSFGGAADFNKDGFTDLLWHNQATWQTVVWNLNGTGFGNAINLLLLNPNWKVTNTGDFNKDGFTDVLLRNQVTGENTIWKLNSTGFSGVINLAIASPNWHLSTTADFDNDGFLDLLWHNQTTGENTTWLMNGAGLKGFTALQTGAEANDLLLGDHGKLYTALPLWQNFFSIDTGASQGGGNDFIVGNQGDDFILGQQGNDFLFGETGEDDMLGGHNVEGGADGDDTMDGGEDEDVMLGDNGKITRRLTGYYQWQRYPVPFDAVIRDVVRFDDRDLIGGNDIMQGGAGEDIMHGQRGNDTMFGNAGDDEMYGQLGNDTMSGGAGQDTMLGDVGIITRDYNPNGTPRLNQNGSWHRDVMLTDVGKLTGNTGISNSLFQSPDLLLLTGAYSNGNRVLNPDGSWRTELQAVSLYADGNDAMDGGSGEDAMFGQRGNDLVQGGSGNDFVQGNAGNDLVSGDDGDDFVMGDEGNNLASFNTEIPNVTRGIHLIDKDASVGVDLGAFGTVITPYVTLVPEMTYGLLPTLTFAPRQARDSSPVPPFGALNAGGGVSLVPLISIVPDIANHLDLINGNDSVSGGSGRDLLVGDDYSSFMPLRTGVGSIDTALDQTTRALYQLVYDLHDLERALAPTLSGSPEIGYGNDILDGGEDGDTVLGDNGILFGPFVHQVPAAGGNLSNLLTDLGQAIANANGVVNALLTPFAGGVNNPTYRLAIANDSINGGGGDDKLFADDSMTIAPLVSSLPYQAGSFFNYGFAGTNRPGRTNFRDFDLKLGNDIVNGGGGNDLAVGGYSTQITPIVTAPVGDRVLLQQSLDTLAADAKAFVRDLFNDRHGIDYTTRDQSNSLIAQNDSLNGEDGNDLMLGDNATFVLPFLNGQIDLSLRLNQGNFDYGDQSHNFFHALPHQYDYIYRNPAVGFTQLGEDAMTGGNGNDILFGLRAIDQINGDAGDDFIFGGEEADGLNGGAGNNTVRNTNPSPGDEVAIADPVRDRLADLLTPVTRRYLLDIVQSSNTLALADDFFLNLPG